MCLIPGLFLKAACQVFQGLGVGVAQNCLYFPCQDLLRVVEEILIADVELLSAVLLPLPVKVQTVNGLGKPLPAAAAA